ncbi:MAG TPA: hypothetical protein VN969_38075 [Streptosporangiaceae bacterium]|nr:hypothetical protein [Streptosporangiaceae bacterium]
MTQTEQESAARAPTSVGWAGFVSAVSGSRITLCALALIAVQVCLNSYVVSNAFFQLDDFAIGGLVAHPLSLSMLFQNYGGHLFPGGFLLAWFAVHADGYDWGLWAGPLVILQGLAGLAMLRALRTLFGNRMLVLIPLAVFLFTPTTMADLTWWGIGIQSVPIQLAIAMAIDQHVRYIRGGRLRNAVFAFAWVLFGLAFYEKSAAIPFLLFALTSAFLVPGSWGQAALTTLRKHWPAWAMYLAAFIAEVVIYTSAVQSSQVRVPLASNVVSFTWDLLWHNFVPAAMGGPWHWIPVASAPKAYQLYLLEAPPELLMLLSWLVAALVVIASLWYRARAWRAWIILLGWLLIVDTAPVVLGRVAIWGPQIFNYAQYVSDAAPVLAVCLGIAYLPLLGEERPYRAIRPRALTQALVIGTVCAVFLAGAVWSDAAYRDGLQPAATRSYVATASQAFSHVPADTVIYPGDVPGPIASSYFLLQLAEEQNALRPLLIQVPGQHFTWTSSPTGRIPSFMIMNAQGQLVPAAIQGLNSFPHGTTLSDCTLRPAGMLLKIDGDVWSYPFVMEIGYFANKPVTLAVSFGGHQYRLTLPASSLAYGYLPVVGPGSTVMITPLTPDPQICIGNITIGNVVPSLTGTPVPLKPVAG